MAESADKRPFIFTDDCRQCQGKKFDPLSGFRLFGITFMRDECITCGGTGKKEYVLRDDGVVLFADNWRKTLEGERAEKVRFLTGEYPTWEALRAMHHDARPCEEPPIIPPRMYRLREPTHPPPKLLQ